VEGAGIESGTEASAETTAEWECIRGSFSYFLSHYVSLGDTPGKQFPAWQWQIDLAERLPELDRLIILKARQLGVSWLLAAYALWRALTRPGATVLLVSQTRDDAVELLAKVQHVFDGLPERLGLPKAKMLTQKLRFPATGSVVEALPSTRRAGRGRTAVLVEADEHAFHQWGAQNFLALSPTVDAGGQFLVVSTADGVGNHFAELWAQATTATPAVMPRWHDGEWRLDEALEPVSRRDGWLPLFLPYDLRPGRDAGWWERKRATYAQSRSFYQEYPRDPEESFVQSGRPVFPKEHLDRQRALCVEPLPRAAWPSGLDGWRTEELRVFAPPQPGHRYAAGADVAEGLEHGDYSSLVLLDADADEGRPTVALTLHGHWPPDEFARRVKEVADLYPGLYGIERNNHGLAVLIAARRLGMRGVYTERPLLNRLGQEVQPGRPGWLTTSVTKPLLIDDLEEALRTDSVELRDALAIPELVFYQTRADGGTGAPSGRWDDRVMALGIAVQMLKRLPPRSSAEDGSEEHGELEPVFGPGMSF
jgi:hypothetical protein